MRRIAVTLLAMALIAAACGDSGESTSSTMAPVEQAPDPTPVATPAPTTTVAPTTTTTSEVTTTTTPEATTTTKAATDVRLVDSIEAQEFTFAGQEKMMPDASATILDVGTGFALVLEFANLSTDSYCAIVGFGDAEFTPEGDFLTVYTGPVCDPALIAPNYVPTVPLFMSDQIMVIDIGEIPHDPFNFFYSFMLGQNDGFFGNPPGDVSQSEIPAVSDREVIFFRGLGGLLRAGDWEVLGNTPSSTGGGCEEDAETMCFHGPRFQAEINFNDPSTTGRGLATLLDETTGLFFFLDEENPDFLIRILNGCDVNNHFWVFGAPSPNVGFGLTVTDTVTGDSRSYQKELGQVAQAITDTQAFATCP